MSFWDFKKILINIVGGTEFFCHTFRNDILSTCNLFKSIPDCPVVTCVVFLLL